MTFVVNIFINNLTDFSGRTIITTFYEGNLTNSRSFLTAPLIRDEILDLRPSEDNHIIVYFTKGFKSLNKMLLEFPREKFILYGFQHRNEKYEADDIKNARCPVCGKQMMRAVAYYDIDGRYYLGEGEINM